MKPILSLVVATACLGTALAQTPKTSSASSAEALFRQGQAAEKTGNVAAAGKAYTEALKADPNHAAARFSLGQLRINAPTIAARAREAKFSAVNVPEFKLDGATLEEAVAALSMIVERETKKAVTPNFIIQDPKNQLANSKISLNLKSTPAGAVMKYLTEMTGTKATYDEHAIVIKPK
jgi:tetratricopeptide (TPR) repeat protein